MLNFPQYLDWSIHKQKGMIDNISELPPKIGEHVRSIEQAAGAPVVMLGTGAEHDEYININI